MATPVSPTAPHLAHRAELLGTENAFGVGPLIAAAEADGQHVIRCNIGEPDFPMPDHIREEVKRQLDLGATGYVDPQGILPLREAIAEDVGRRRRLEVAPDRVVVFPGAKPAIGLAQQTYCDPGDEIIYPEPGFPIYGSFSAYLGIRPVPLRLRPEAGFEVRADDLQPLITDRTRLIFLNSPANPTGSVTPRVRLEEIAEVIRRKAPAGVRVFSDEIYERIVFDDAEHVSIASLPEMESRTIIVSGVSKSFAWTGGRVGWAVFPTREEAAIFRNLNINYFSSIPPYNQYGAVAALRSPASAPAVAEMVASFEARRDTMLDRLDEIQGVTCRRPDGAFYLFPDVGGACERVGAVRAWERLPAASRERSSPATLFQMFLLFHHGVATLDGRSFGNRLGTAGRHLRLSIATGIDQLHLAADRLALAAADEAGFASFMAGRGADL